MTTNETSEDKQANPPIHLEKSARPPGNSVMENIKILNSSARTLVVLVFLGIFSYIGWIGYQKYVRPGFEAERMRKDLAALQVKFEEQGVELVKTKTALKLVKVDYRKATVKVLEKGVDEVTNNPWFDVEFTEITPDGIPISAPRKFRLNGTMLYVDTWVVKFEDKYVEEADELRGGSLCVFKGLWGDLDEKDQRAVLDDSESGAETAYGRLDNQSEFEKRIWDDFWDLANHPEKQAELGVRANHGQINYLRADPGMIYEVNLRASDGMTIKVAKDNNT